MSNYKRNSKNTNNKKGNKAQSNDVKEYKMRRRNQGRDFIPADKLDRRTATNDPAWYGLDPNLLRDSSSLPFSAAVGTPLTLHNPALEVLSGQEFTIPGIQVIYTCPSVGRSIDPSSPLNAATFRTYTFVRHQNSGHSNYDPTDLMIYLLSMTQVYSYINFLQRAYGIVTTYAQKNRYMPDALLSAMDIDADDCRLNLAAFRYGINVLINKAASLCVPSTMPIFKRMATIYSNLYIEGNSIKDQLYLYSPEAFWKFTLDDTGAGKLEWKTWRHEGKKTVEDMLEYGNDMLARLIQSEDMNIMSGDILKAYGSDSLIKLAPLPLDYPIIPLPDSAVLNQMKNTTVTWWLDADSMHVVQDPTHGWLYCNPTMKYSREASYQTRANTFLLQSFLEDRILTINNADPTPEEVMEYTRGMIIARKFDRSEDGLTATCEFDCGVEIATTVSYFGFDVVDGVPLLHELDGWYLDTVDVSDSDAVALYFEKMANLSNFRFHPMHRIAAYRQGTNPDAFNITHMYGCYDVDNYTVISEQVLRRIHEAALMSLFNVPSMVRV